MLRHTDQASILRKDSRIADDEVVREIRLMVDVIFAQRIVRRGRFSRIQFGAAAKADSLSSPRKAAIHNH
jgi:hypothetical protein